MPDTATNSSTTGVSLADIRAVCDGELLGDPEATVTGVASLGHAGPDDLSFLVDSRSVTDQIEGNPGVLLVKPDDQALFSGNRVLVADPYLAYARVSALFAIARSDSSPSIHTAVSIDPSAVIGDGLHAGAQAVVGRNCRIGARVRLGPGVVVEANCDIGDDTVIESGAVICRDTRLGLRCLVSPGAVIGSSGFGYAPSSAGWQKIHQLGGVIVGDDVDIGSNATIDRGAIDDTVIGDRVKIDNHVQIAHNVQVGDDTIMAAFVGIAGSAKIGKRCQFGGRSSIMGHITICDDVVVHTNTFVARSIDEPGTFSSMLPAQPASQWRKTVVLLNRLDKLASRIRKGQ